MSGTVATIPKAETARLQLERFCRQDWDAYRSALSPEAVYREIATGRRLEGPDAIVAGLQTWTIAFPDITARIMHIGETGDTVYAELTWDATHTGPLMTAEGRIEPNGARGSTPAIIVFEFEGDRIREMRHYFDMLGMIRRAKQPQKP